MARPKAGVTFWDRVNEHTRLNGECHQFHGHLDECGYGRIQKDGKLVRVHRAVWEKNNGPIAKGLVICHTCDNPACHNIEHLFVGTQADNVADMWKKKRANILQGSERPMSKLTETDIPIIRDWLSLGYTSYSVGRAYSVTGEAILAIKHGKTWKYA